MIKKNYCKECIDAKNFNLNNKMVMYNNKPSEEKVKVIIDNHEYEVSKNLTILEACKSIGIHIPTLCNHDMLYPLGSCRLCVVEIEGAKKLFTACTTPIKQGMIIFTHSSRVLEARKTNIKLLIVNHKNNCLTCSESSSCELFKIADQLEIDYDAYPDLSRDENIKDNSSPCFTRNNDICIHCGKCVEICSEMQNVNAIGLINRGNEVEPGCPFGMKINDTKCINCGQCVLHCPTNALKEKIQVPIAWDYINNKSLHVVAQTAPSVRVSIGEEFGMEPGSVTTGKLVTALRRIGFDRVFDTQTGADLTIMEEATEAIGRLLENKGKIPIMTSCCAAWVNYIYNFYPELKDNLSSAKSPQTMLGRVIKEYYAKNKGIDQKNIRVVSIMPCIAKKDEILKKGNKGDVDLVLTTREFADMIKQAGLEFRELEDSDFDNPLGESSGAGAIFGTTGGVMEAALRTAYELKTGQKLEKIEFNQIRGIDFVKEGSIEMLGKKINFLVCHGISNIAPFLDDVKNGKSKYHFIEVMACPGGCIGGGGQPKPTNKEVIQKRMQGLYSIDASKIVRRSYENKAIKELYEKFLQYPGSEIAEKLLHVNHNDNNID